MLNLINLNANKEYLQAFYENSMPVIDVPPSEEILSEIYERKEELATIPGVSRSQTPTGKMQALVDQVNLDMLVIEGPVRKIKANQDLEISDKTAFMPYSTIQSRLNLRNTMPES